MAGLETAPCPYCGAANRVSAFFCTGCGKPIRDRSQGPPAEQRSASAPGDSPKRAPADPLSEETQEALKELKLPYKLPFKAGESPCKIKGASYAGSLRNLSLSLPGGVRSLLPYVEDDSLRDFFAQRFLPSGLYDIFPLPLLLAYQAAIEGINYQAHLQAGALERAKHDLKGIYRPILETLAPSGVIERVYRIGETYYSWSSPPPTFPEPGCCVMHRKMPTLLGSWYDAIAAGYFEAIFAQTGAKIVEYVRLEDEALPLESGLSWIVHRRRIRWKES